MNIHIYNLFYICTGTHACTLFLIINLFVFERGIKKKRFDNNLWYFRDAKGLSDSDSESISNAT